MRTLLLIRHSAVAIDPERPSREWTLSAEGRARCTDLALELTRHDPGVFVSSVEPKAGETAQLLAEALGRPWTTAEGLHEHRRDSVPYFASRATFEAAVAQFFARPDEPVLGEETAVQARHRFISAVDKVLAAHPTGNVAIVSHGTVITLFLSYYNPHLEPFSLWRSLTLPCYFVVSGRWQIQASAADSRGTALRPEG